MTTYKIVRFYVDNKIPSRTIKEGLTLEEARRHCKSVDSKGEDWFDGYIKE